MTVITIEAYRAVDADANELKRAIRCDAAAELIVAVTGEASSPGAGAADHSQSPEHAARPQVAGTKTGEYH